MKKTNCAVLASLIVCLAVGASVLPAFAKNMLYVAPIAEENRCSELLTELYGSTEDTTVSLINQYVSVDNFGGMYYNDDGQLVINIVDFDSRQALASVLELNGLSDVQFVKVQYSLEFLESAKKSLVPYMEALNIIELDADDVKNTLNIAVSNMSTENVDAIMAVLSNLSIPTVCVNIEDKSDSEISFTVADSKPIASSEPSPIGPVVWTSPGNTIYIKESMGYCTLGPY